MPYICLLDTCCCCVDLRLGSFVIGYTDLVTTIALMCDLWNLPKDLNSENGLNRFSNDNKNGQNVTMVIPEKLGEHIMIVSYTLNSLKLIFIIGLLFGLHKSKRVPVASYLIHTILHWMFCVALIVSAVAIILKNVNDSVILLIVWVLTFVSMIPIALPLIYFWWVILSHYFKMADGSTIPTALPHRTTSRRTNLELPVG